MTSWNLLEVQVELRAGGRCEYCQMYQSLQGATFHVEHIVPRCRGGSSPCSQSRTSPSHSSSRSSVRSFSRARSRCVKPASLGRQPRILIEIACRTESLIGLAWDASARRCLLCPLYVPLAYGRRLRHTCAHLPSQFGHDEIDGLVHLFEQRALDKVVRRNRLCHRRAVDMQALHFGRGQRSLRVRPEQEHSGIPRLITIQ
jgi:hypothetical protein